MARCFLTGLTREKAAACTLARRSLAAMPRVTRRQAAMEFRGGGTGGECPISGKEKSLGEYSKWTNGRSRVIARFVQIMSIFGVSSWRSDFFSAVLALLTT
jgi:hypothetical protein